MAIDIVSVLKHSPNQDFELRYSLRSIERHAPYVRKIWIFGDRPAFMSDDTSVIEHIAEDYTAHILGANPPIRNMFLRMVLSSFIPDLTFEYLYFSDDYFLLRDYPIDDARKDRFFEDLTVETGRPRGTGLWKESFWRTRDLLVRRGYSAYNFESHVPICLTKKRVLDAYLEFRDFVTEDRDYGMMGISAVLNHAIKHETGAARRPLIALQEEKSRGGFWGMQPNSHEAILAEAENKMFFNFNDRAFGPLISCFLQDRFPNRSRFEKE
jgi:Stealth protein CR2, conserved region 2